MRPTLADAQQSAPPLVETRAALLLCPGTPKPAEEVKELISELNIQFDNLCQVRSGVAAHRATREARDVMRCARRPLASRPGLSLPLHRPARPRTTPLPSPLPAPSQFLPQDRVASFAHMDSYELLAATQKAIGDSTLFDQHQQLISRREELRAQSTVRRRRALGPAVGAHRRTLHVGRGCANPLLDGLPCAHARQASKLTPPVCAVETSSALSATQTPPCPEPVGAAEAAGPAGGGEPRAGARRGALPAPPEAAAPDQGHSHQGAPPGARPRVVGARCWMHDGRPAADMPGTSPSTPLRLVAAQEVWAGVTAKEAQLVRDERMLAAAQEMAAKHAEDAADDAGPLKCVAGRLCRGMRSGLCSCGTQSAAGALGAGGAGGLLCVGAAGPPRRLSPDSDHFSPYHGRAGRPSGASRRRSSSWRACHRRAARRTPSAWRTWAPRLGTWCAGGACAGRGGMPA